MFSVKDPVPDGLRSRVVYKGLFTWREEDPSTGKMLEGGKKFGFGLHAEISAEVLTKWRRKRRKIIALYQLNALLPSCFFFCP